LTSEIRRLAMTADTTVTVAHDESDPEALAKDVMAKCECELVNRVKILVTTVFVPGMVGVDLADIRQLFYRTGLAGYCYGVCDSSPTTECPARMAVRRAYFSLSSIGEARGVMVIFSGSVDSLQLSHYANGMKEIRDLLDSHSPDILTLGLARWDDAMPTGRIGVEIWTAGGGHA
jgi:cell division GTPase FtsZ